MSALREKLLQVIYTHFEQWTLGHSFPFACTKGCATCCTQNVTMTAVEGDLIHRFIKENTRQGWFADKLQLKKSQHQTVETTNEFAQKCLSGQNPSGQETVDNEAKCPFLEHDRCQIYEVRPFICRSFASVKKCRVGQVAALPQFYISAATAVQQLLEHVGQGEYWGNMLDVLLALCDLKENEETGALLPSRSMADQARARLRKAKPIPGFLISAEDYDRVGALISGIFAEKIGNRTVEDILNGR